MDLREKNEISIEPASVLPEALGSGVWDARAETDIVNSSGASARLVLFSEIFDAEGVRVGQARTELDISPRERVRLEQSVLAYGIQDALYTMRSSLYRGEELLDRARTSFAFRENAE